MSPRQQAEQRASGGAEPRVREGAEHPSPGFGRCRFPGRNARVMRLGGWSRISPARSPATITTLIAAVASNPATLPRTRPRIIRATPGSLDVSSADRLPGTPPAKQPTAIGIAVAPVTGGVEPKDENGAPGRFPGFP
nr:hypothetical protein GCM10020093_004980 [Planobispora longispora]